jgi:hypothetical protein
MIWQENIITAYRARKEAMNSGNVAEWANKNESARNILADTEKILDAD